MTNDAKLIVGWKEWGALPLLDIPFIKVKIDTGAQTSAIHAENIRLINTEQGQWVEFVVEPLNGKPIKKHCRLPLVDSRTVVSSNGHKEKRYVVKTLFQLGCCSKEIEMTLTSRHLMRFNMLIGRQALRHFALVDSGKSYLHGKLSSAYVLSLYGHTT